MTENKWLLDPGLSEAEHKRYLRRTFVIATLIYWFRIDPYFFFPVIRLFASPIGFLADDPMFALTLFDFLRLIPLATVIIILGYVSWIIFGVHAVQRLIPVYKVDKIEVLAASSSYAGVFLVYHYYGADFLFWLADNLSNIGPQEFLSPIKVISTGLLNRVTTNIGDWFFGVDPLWIPDKPTPAVKFTG